MEGYESIRDLGTAQLATAAPLIMLRLIMVIGWMETHRHTFPDNQASDYADVVAEFGERYLRGELLELAVPRNT